MMYEFEAPVTELNFDGYRQTVVYLPAQLARELGLKGRVRCRGRLGATAFAGAWQPSQGRWFLLVSKTLMKRAGCAAGDWISITFRLAPDDEVDVPRELAAALDEQPALRTAWDALTPGLRRSYAHRVASAKTPATRERRVEEVLAWVADKSMRPRRGK